MTVDTITNATGGGSAGTAAPVGMTGVTIAPAISDPVIWQETPDHGNYNPGTKIGQTIFKTKTIFDSVGTATSFANILQDYSSIKLETVQCAAIDRFSTAIVFTDPIPAPPFTTLVLDPANNTADKQIFHSRVNSHAHRLFCECVVKKLGECV